jgi:hypothetical protein
MGNVGAVVGLVPTPDPDVVAGSERFCRTCRVPVATQTAVLGFVGFLTPTEAFGGSWGPWHFCTAHVPAQAVARRELGHA